MPFFFITIGRAAVINAMAMAIKSGCEIKPDNANSHIVQLVMSKPLKK